VYWCSVVALECVWFVWFNVVGVAEFYAFPCFIREVIVVADDFSRVRTNATH
jgi:hypothetical protein